MPTNPEDVRAGRLLILLRRRSHVTQIQIAASAGVPRRDVQLVEDGLAGRVPLDRLRRIFEAAGARGRFGVWWNGAAADRLLDERHATLVERAVGTFQARGWRPLVEVSFSEYGERGSIDILAGHATMRAVAVSEVKSDVGSIEETNRVLDVKERLAPKISERAFGWRPATVGRLLILADETANRRVVGQHERTIGAVYPARGREVRRWLREPAGPLRGIWFLSPAQHRGSISPPSA